MKICYFQKFFVFHCHLWFRGPKKANDNYNDKSEHKHVKLCLILFLLYMCKFDSEHNLSTVDFLVKLPDGLPKLALMLDVRHARPS